MQSIVIGLGETGRPLYELLKGVYPTFGYDIKDGLFTFPVEHLGGVLNICIPYSPAFAEVVKGYQDIVRPCLTIIHSTVPIGTTDKIPNAVHSPIKGRHLDMKSDMLRYEKWVGGSPALVQAASDYLEGVGFDVHPAKSSRATELLKLVCLAKYGKDIAFAFYADDLCQKYDVPYSYVLAWDMDYNKTVSSHLQRPIIGVDEHSIGGHCVTQNTAHLNASDPNPMLSEVLKYAR